MDSARFKGLRWLGYLIVTVTWRYCFWPRPRISSLEKICLTEDQPLEWLISGNDSLKEFVTIPGLELAASAGDGSYVISEDESQGIKVTKHWLHEKGLCQKSLVMIKTVGDSMLPTIPEGASIIVDTTDKLYQREGVYAIRNGEELCVKRLRYDSFEQELNIISDNPLYPIRTVKSDKLVNVCVIGRVVKLLVDI